jgi:translation elongation factor EF-Tu-like GTPase
VIERELIPEVPVLVRVCVLLEVNVGQILPNPFPVQQQKIVIHKYAMTKHEKGRPTLPV